MIDGFMYLPSRLGWQTMVRVSVKGDLEEGSVISSEEWV
jgi:hypothetical protein